MSGPSTNATRDHWDSLAADYDLFKAQNAAYLDALIGLAERFVPADWRRRVLEVGCGTGQIIAALQPHVGVGIDLSERMIAQARQAHGHKANLSFRVLDGARADSLGRFDAVICIDVLEHVENWPAVASSLVRAVEPGGVLLILTPNPSWAVPLWTLEKLRLKMPEGPHRFVHRREIAAAIEAQGCETMHVGTAALVPSHLGGGGPRISRWAEDAPILRNLGVIQIVAAARMQST